MSYRDGLKMQYAKLDALDVLRLPSSALLGVSTAVETTLKKFGINTVFDLAASSLFNTANEIALASLGQGNNPIARMGRIPGTFIDADAPATPAALAGADIVMLREIGPTLADEIKDALQVETVSDLGRFPPFRAAKIILQAAIALPEDQVDEASELVPRLGEYPTERHYYRSVVIDHVTPGDTQDLASAGPIDISPTVSADFGFKAPAVGAILTFAQSWFAQGLTLGNLLHSVALAPGESTRIAVLDWARRTSARGEENIAESERLTNVSSHNRSISEVQDAVAKEVQTGFSKTSSTATTEAGGGGFGLSLGPLTVGGSGTSSTSTTSGESFSSSAGSRNLSASMNQRIADSTQQAASSVRDRRASIVKEVSEEEHQSVSTRIIANYNHMHALTVQYFEVIENYRVNVHLQQVERCLFVPMKLVNFKDDMIERYRAVLAAAALNKRARELLLSDFGTVRLQPAVTMQRCGTIFDRMALVDRASVFDRANVMATHAASLRDATMAVSPSAAMATPAATPATPAPATPAAGATPVLSAALMANAVNNLAWMNDEVSRAARLTMINVTKPGRNDLFLPDDAELNGVTFALSSQGDVAVSLTTVQVLTQSGGNIALTALNPVEWTTATPIPLQEIDQIRVSSSQANYFSGKMTLQLNYGSGRFPITFPVEIVPHAVLQQVCRIIPNETSGELRMHLEENRLHYSQAIWRALDPSSIALLLSAFTFEGMPVADQIDPNPVMVASNYLVFRMPGYVEAVGVFNPRRDGDEHSPEMIAYNNWHTWLNARGLILGSEAGMEQIVPVPTSGVFAEAVLGRSNSAEKLDATRFWNWQDSPIPLQPPEIAAIQMESRAQPVDVTPGHLGAPILNIMNPTSLPDPAGINSIMGALQNGNMFRDMAGLATTAGLAQAVSGNATSAGVEVGRQAAANLAVAAQKDIEEKRIAAQLAMAAMGLPAGNAGTPKNISESGALFNTAKEMDAMQGRGGGAQGGGATGGDVMDDTSGGSSSGGGGGGDSSGDDFDSSYMPGVDESFGGGSRADDVLSKMTWGNLGLPAGSLILAGKGKSGKSVSTPIIFELGFYGSFPRPWADDAAEIQGIQNAKWLPSSDDFDAMGGAATAAAGGTKPYAQAIMNLADVISTVNYFAPMVPGFSTSHPARVKRLNLFFYSAGSQLEFSATLKTNGTWVSVLGPTMDIDASVIDTSIISKVRTASGNKAKLKKLKSAWDSKAEIFLYTAGGVPSDALAKAFAKLMGAKVRAFTEPFWVLPRYDATQNTFSSRDEFGIGTDFTAATSNRTKDLHTLDSLATRSFNP